MTTFLARLATATAATPPVPKAASKPAGIDARALQARLAAELGDDRRSPDPDADLLTLYRQYREARKDMHKIFAGRVYSDAESDLILSRYDGFVRAIARMRARTQRGFGAKMDVLRHCGCPALDRVCPQNSDEILLQSIATDSYWLFGAGEALVAEEKEKNEARDQVSMRSGA